VTATGAVCLVQANLLQEIEQFLYLEAELLDDRRFEEWLDLLTDDVRYWMPTRTIRTTAEMSQSVGRPTDVALFDDDKDSLVLRVKRLGTGMAWAEEPPSFTRRIVGNIRVATLTDAPDEVEVKSNFIFYRNRLRTEEVLLTGTRTDRLRRGNAELSIAARMILLDQSVVLAKSITSFL
jgi:3-phenylpropionate/cinnamic acid dioxygenase small subunit